MTLRVTVLSALLLLWAACPPGPVSTPKPTWSRWDEKARLEKGLAAARAKPAATRAALHRDLGWLLLMHFGDPKRATVQLEKARAAAGNVPAPWVYAGLALVADLRLDVKRSTLDWLRTLDAVAHTRKYPHRGLRPLAGLSLDHLSLLAARRLRQQLPHTQAVDDPVLVRLARKQGVEARAALMLARVGSARRKGEPSGVKARLLEAGCPHAYRLSRRYGRFGRTDLGRAFAPERQDRLTGPPKTRLACSLWVRSPDGAAGVRYVEASFRAGGGGRALLRVVWPRPFVLWHQGKKRFDVEDRFAPRPSARWINLRLAPGTNRVRLKLPVFGSGARLQLQIVRQVDAPSPVTGRVTELYRPLADALEVTRALHRGLSDAGRGAAARLVKKAPRFAWGLYMVARLERADGLLGAGVRRSRETAAVDRVLKRAPWATRLRLRKASLLRRRAKGRQALQLLAAVSPAQRRAPGADRLLALAQVRLYRQLDWRALALRRAAALARAHPRWLPAQKVHYLLALAAGSAAATRAAAERVHRLDATSFAWAQLLARLGRHAEAVAEAQRLLRLRGDPRLLRLVAEQLRRAGKPARAAWQRLVARAAWDGESRLGLANLLVAAGQRAEARRLLQKSMRARPQDSGLRQALRALDVAGPLDHHRVDGRQVIAAFRKANWGTGKAPVYVLDRTVVRVFKAGGRLTLTHQIVQLKTKEAISKYAEVKLPPGVRVLTLRTVKKDGTVREPEDVGEKRSVSLQDVDEGDFIEVEYLAAGSPQRLWRAGGFFGSSFSFRSLAAHFYLSELVVITPPKTRLQTTRWGATPKPVVRMRRGLRETWWTARRAERVLPEPLIPQLAGILPTVLVGAKVRWSDYLRQRGELTYDAQVASHGVRQLATKLCKKQPTAVGARAAYAWVQKHVEESGDYGRSASRTLAARSGSRLNLLGALLRHCGAKGLETRLLRPRHRLQPKGDLPAVRLYSQPALWLKLPDGEAYLMPQLQQAPFGYLPPLFRRASAASVDRPGTPTAQTPDQPAADARRTALTVTLAANGSAEISGTERLHGLLGLQFRAALRRVPARQLRQWLERAFFGRFFLGAVIKRLKFKHAEALDKPLVMTYRLAVPRLARPVKGPGGIKRLVLRSGFFPALVGRIYARLAKRRLPLRLGPMGPMSLRLLLLFPTGYSVTELPEPVQLKTPFGRFSLKATKRPGVVEIRRDLVVPFGIVSPARYPAFTLFAARVDRAERIQVVLDRK